MPHILCVLVITHFLLECKWLCDFVFCPGCRQEEFLDKGRPSVLQTAKHPRQAVKGRRGLNTSRSWVIYRKQQTVSYKSLGRTVKEFLFYPIPLNVKQFFTFFKLHKSKNSQRKSLPTRLTRFIRDPVEPGYLYGFWRSFHLPLAQLVVSTEILTGVPKITCHSSHC